MQSSVNKLYFNRPELWERRNQHRFEMESDFLHQCFQQYGAVRGVLDVGCGTGGHLSILKQKYGYRVSGVDLSESMIRYAKDTLPEVDLHVMDMRELPFIDAFDAIICLHTTFPYNQTNEQILQALNRFYRALNGEGLLVIDVLNAIRFMCRGFAPRLERVHNQPGFSAKEIVSHEVDFRNQTLIARWTWEIDGSTQSHQEQSTFRLFFPQELRLFLEICGFEWIEFFSDYSGSTDLSGTRLITLARKVSRQSCKNRK